MRTLSRNRSDAHRKKGEVFREQKRNGRPTPALNQIVDDAMFTMKKPSEDHAHDDPGGIAHGSNSAQPDGPAPARFRVTGEREARGQRSRLPAP